MAYVHPGVGCGEASVCVSRGIQDGFTERGRDRDRQEEALGIEIVLAGFVDHTNLTMFQSDGIGKSHVDLSFFKRNEVPLVLYTDQGKNSGVRPFNGLRKNSAHEKMAKMLCVARWPEQPQDAQKGRPLNPSFGSRISSFSQERFPGLRDTLHGGRFTVFGAGGLFQHPVTFVSRRAQHV